MTDPRTGRICGSMMQWMEVEKHRMQEAILEKQRQLRLIHEEYLQCKLCLNDLRNLFFEIFGRDADELPDDLFIAELVESED